MQVEAGELFSGLIMSMFRPWSVMKTLLDTAELYHDSSNLSSVLSGRFFIFPAFSRAATLCYNFPKRGTSQIFVKLVRNHEAIGIL